MIIYNYFLCDILIECSYLDRVHIFVYCFSHSWSCCLAQAGLELMTALRYCILGVHHHTSVHQSKTRQGEGRGQHGSYTNGLKNRGLWVTKRMWCFCLAINISNIAGIYTIFSIVWGYGKHWDLHLMFGWSCVSVHLNCYYKIPQVFISFSLLKSERKHQVSTRFWAASTPCLLPSVVLTVKGAS